MSKNIVHIDSIGRIIDDILGFYNSGQVKSIMAVLILKDGCHVCTWHNKTDFLRLLGMCETVKADIIAKAEERI